MQLLAIGLLYKLSCGVVSSLEEIPGLGFSIPQPVELPEPQHEMQMSSLSYCQSQPSQFDCVPVLALPLQA
jgi:hypothetical protein